MSSRLHQLAQKISRLWKRELTDTQPSSGGDYSSRLEQELANFADDIDVHALPQIFHYWSNRYVRPWFEEVGTTHPEDLFAHYLIQAAKSAEDAPRFLSIGSGNCDAEVAVALDLRARGLENFTLECMDINPKMLARGQQLAEQRGVADCMAFQCADFNDWTPPNRYDGIVANQCLHHVTNLEGLFDAIQAALTTRGLFITSDMIGRNGHMRWPEALEIVEKYWSELPERYRYNHQHKRLELEFVNHDCSVGCFEGIRAQDILPLLLPRFKFHVFIAFGNVIDPFIDRGFGHNFDANNPDDLAFVDRLHAEDEAGFASGSLKPTHMIAVMSRPEHPPEQPYYARGLGPDQAVRPV